MFAAHATQLEGIVVSEANSDARERLHDDRKVCYNRKEHCTNAAIAAVKYGGTT
jgi:hypothetical protein